MMTPEERNHRGTEAQRHRERRRDTLLRVSAPLWFAFSGRPRDFVGCQYHPSGAPLYSWIVLPPSTTSICPVI
jgi:hypothetical protein